MGWVGKVVRVMLERLEAFCQPPTSLGQVPPGCVHARVGYLQGWRPTMSLGLSSLGRGGISLIQP